MAPSGPRTCSARARHDDTPGRPHDLGHRPLSQRSFLWPKRLTAGGAGAKEASSGAVGPGEALGTLVTISGYVKRPRYARLNTPMGADGAISCMSCASYCPDFYEMHIEKSIVDAVQINLRKHHTKRPYSTTWH